MELSDLILKSHRNAYNKCFWEDEECVIEKMVASNLFGQKDINVARQAFMAQKLMLIASELGEALEALRKGDAINFREELADVIIRMADMAGGYDIDLETEIKDKMQKNKARPKKHGKEF